jgi:hypothetical protein
VGVQQPLLWVFRLLILRPIHPNVSFGVAELEDTGISSSSSSSPSHFPFATGIDVVVVVVVGTS